MEHFTIAVRQQYFQSKFVRIPQHIEVKHTIVDVLNYLFSIFPFFMDYLKKLPHDRKVPKREKRYFFKNTNNCLVFVVKQTNKKTAMLISAVFPFHLPIKSGAGADISSTI